MKKIILISLLILLPLCLFAEDTVEPDNTAIIIEDNIPSNEIAITESDEKAKKDNTFFQVFNYDGSYKEDEDQRPYFQDDVNLFFLTHLYLDTMMLHGYPTVGGIWDIGMGINTISIAFYLRYEHIFRPLGSDTGALAVGEELSEIGLSLRVRIYELGRFNISLGVSTGWYQQWLMYSFNRGTYSLMNNGLMIRPEASIGFRFIKNWSMNLGFFYQTPLYPVYDGYQGWGWYLKIF